MFDAKSLALPLYHYEKLQVDKGVILIIPSTFGCCEEVNRYLKYALDKGIWISSSTLLYLEIYCDSN